ncbi:MAG: hypothetical protein HRU15_15560, partial [Planctomycetes bacterium]|nr:hypothetical protein [Planctomycetota bacterium]
MKNRIKGPEAISYRSHLLRSVGLHGVLIGLISFALWQQSEGIREQEKRVIENLQDKEAALIEEEEAAQKSFVRESAEQKVLQELQSVLSDDLDSATVESLQKRLEQNLADLFAKQEDIDEDLLQELRLSLLEEMEFDAQELLLDAIIAQMRKYIRSDLAPKLVDEMERSLKDQGGGLIGKAFQAFIHKHKEQKSAANILHAALDPMHQQLADEIERSIKVDLVPPATEKVLDKFTEQISKFGINGKKLRPFISEDIVKAMIEAMLELERNEELATLRSRVSTKIASTDELKETKEKIDQHIAEAEKLLIAQKDLIEEIKTEEKTAEASAEKQIADLDSLYKEAAETLHDATTQNVNRHNGRVNKSRSLADQKRALGANQQAHLQIQMENKQQAERHSEYAKKQLQEFVNSMKGAQEVLQMDIDARSEQVAVQEPNKNEAMLAQQLHEQLRKDIQAVSKKSSQQAVEKMRVDDVLGELGEELEAAIDMTHKIA